MLWPAPVKYRRVRSRISRRGRMRFMDGIYRFERQPYQQELEVEVLRVEEKSGGWEAFLDDSILYPEGGGQPSDRGRLNDVEVTHVEKTDEGPAHHVVAPIETGKARLVLDWERRYDHMQQHTAQHILTRTAGDRFGWSTRSFHIGPVVSDIELDCGPPQPAEVEQLEAGVAEIIVQARPIRGYRVSPDEFSKLDVRSRGLPAGHAGDIRLVEIEGFDLNTCGGTHLISSAEVEVLKVVAAEPLRGGCRLFWVAGKRVRTRLATHDQRMVELRRLLDSGDDEIVGNLRLRMDQLQRARRAQRWLENRLAGSLASESISQAGDLVDLHLEGFEAPMLRPLAEAMTKSLGRRVAMLTAESESGFLFAVVVGQETGIDVRTAGRGVAEIFGGRGGGAGQVFQGKAENLTDRSNAVGFLSSLLP